MPVTAILASVDDINTFLPTDKLDASSAGAEAAINLLEIEVARLITGCLSGVFTPTVLASWDTPDDTPDYIRSIAGRLIAAMWYAQRYSEDLETPSNFAQNLYNIAMGMIQCVRIGEVIIPNIITETMFTDDFFLPNANSTPPKFSMDIVFG
jgi:hypothetical protein